MGVKVQINRERTKFMHKKMGKALEKGWESGVITERGCAETNDTASLQDCYPDGLEELAGTVADDDVDDDGLLAELGLELFLGSLHEAVVVVLINEVDGAAAEAAAHDT